MQTMLALTFPSCLLKHCVILIFYDLKFLGPLEFKLVAPIPEQSKTNTMHFYEASRKRYYQLPAKKLGGIFPLFFVYRAHWKTWIPTRFFPIGTTCDLINVNLVYFAQLSLWQLLIYVSWHLREMQYCGPNPFWDGCNEIQIWVLMIRSYTMSCLLTFVVSAIFEPTCANCTVGSYASLSVCLSVCPDLTKNRGK